MPVRQLSDGNSDGTVLGQSAADKISFYNVTPATQRAGAAQAAVDTTAPTNASPFGFSQAQANGLLALVNEMRATLRFARLNEGFRLIPFFGDERMTTVRDVVQGAYARLALLPLGQDLDPDRAIAGLNAFNDMLSSFAAQGLDIGFALAALSDPFPLDARHVQGVKALLAVQLASNSGVEALPGVQREAKQGWDAILAQYISAPCADQDPGLTWLPSLRRYGFR